MTTQDKRTAARQTQCSDDCTVYRLTPKGREMRYADWIKMRGCELSHYSETHVASSLRLPSSRWGELTLGEIADVFVVAGREFARCASNHFSSLALGEPDPLYSKPEDRRV